MPPNTLRIHTEYMLVKSVGPKVLWVVAAETTGAEGRKIFHSPPTPCLNCGGGDWWCRNPTPVSGSAAFHSQEGHEKICISDILLVKLKS
ncbi:hypothetical protein TNCV_878611 [Trichonephila clavipes]|nr:hypothetical protein TNCV_878611 [Trichonephila clavipes]